MHLETGTRNWNADDPQCRDTSLSCSTPERDLAAEYFESLIKEKKKGIKPGH